MASKAIEAWKCGDAEAGTQADRTTDTAAKTTANAVEVVASSTITAAEISDRESSNGEEKDQSIVAFENAIAHFGQFNMQPVCKRTGSHGKYELHVCGEADETYGTLTAIPGLVITTPDNSKKGKGARKKFHVFSGMKYIFNP